jgi:phage terminase large subunit-like protein
VVYENGRKKWTGKDLLLMSYKKTEELRRRYRR